VSRFRVENLHCDRRGWETSFECCRSPEPFARGSALAATLSVVALTTTGTAARDSPPVSVTPSEGGQGTTFDIRFTAAGQDVGPDTGGDTIELSGPAGTPCADIDNLSFEIGFGSGTAHFKLGPRAPRPRFESNVASLRPVTSWCPGTYRGSVIEIVANNLAPNETLGAFEFHVRPTRPSQGGPRVGDVFVSEQLPRDPRVNVRPRRGGPGRVFRVSFRARINGRLELDLRPRSPGCSLESEALSYYLPFRRGRATLLIGGRLKPGRRTGNVWAIRPAARLCRGEWAGFAYIADQDVDFGFTVVS
jgi:hypothetical protein